MENENITSDPTLNRFFTPVDKMQKAVYIQAIKALLLDMKINRNFTSTNCRSYVSALTGKKYPAGKKGLQSALDDLVKK